MDWVVDTVYLWAAEKGFHELMKLLLPICLDTISSINLALYLSCEYGHVEIVKDLFSKGAKEVETTHGYALNITQRRDTEIIKILLEHGAREGMCSTLISSCAEGNLEIVKLFLQAGALDKKEATKYLIKII